MPFVPNSGSEREQMLKAIGVEKIEDLFSDIPVSKRFPTLDLPNGVSEMEALAEVESLSRKNAATTDFNHGGVALTAQLTTLRVADSQGRCATIVNAQADFAVGDVLNMVNAAGNPGAQVGEAYIWVVPAGANTATAS